MTIRDVRLAQIHQAHGDIVIPRRDVEWISRIVWSANSIVFDGARSFEGVTPDLAHHCERAVNSCRAFVMNPTVSTHGMVEIALDGVAKFASGA
jgi:branched-subunit amino acid aminotransferase/4-amino-4-deoxychorismate lyase